MARGSSDMVVHSVHYSHKSKCPEVFSTLHCLNKAREWGVRMTDVRLQSIEKNITIHGVPIIS